MTILEKVARAVCGTTASGFCCNVGASLGCKVGRGEAYDGTNCIASRGQLILSGHWNTAEKMVEALRKPSEMIVRAADDAWHHEDAEDAGDMWRAAIDAILSEGN